jgi:hypothetical protein
MIRADSFLALEASLTKRLSLLHDRLNEKVYASIEEALSKQAWDSALQQVESVNAYLPFEEARKYAEWITDLAML